MLSATEDMANLHDHHQRLSFPPESKIPADITGTLHMGSIAAVVRTTATTCTTSTHNTTAAITTTTTAAAAAAATCSVTSGNQQHPKNPSNFPVDHNFYSEPQNCWDSIERFKEMQTNFNEAGTCLVDAFANSLKNTPYERFSHDCSMVLGGIFGSNPLLLTQINELENLLSSLLTNVNVLNKEDYQKSQTQTMAKCVVLFLKIQYDYHRHCSEALASFLQRVTQQTNADILSLLLAVNMTSVRFPQSATSTVPMYLSQMKNAATTTSTTDMSIAALPPHLQGLGNLANLQNSGSVMKGHEVLEAVQQHQQHPSSCTAALPYPACPILSPYPLSSSSSPSSSSSVFTTPPLSSSTEMPFSLFTKTNNLYTPPPIGAAAGQSTQICSNISNSSSSSSNSSSSSSSSNNNNNNNNPILTVVVNPTAATQTITTAAAIATQCPDPGATWPKLSAKPAIRAIGKNEKGVTVYTKSSAKSNSQIASEEELDSVINLLSGSVNLLQQAPLHVPSQLQLSPLHQSSTTGTSNSMFSSLVSSPDIDDPQQIYKGNHVHRRSEGSLDLSGMTSLVGVSNSSYVGGGSANSGGGVRGGGRNTWPHPGYHHRSSLPAGPLGSQNLLNYDQREDYSRILRSNSSLDQRNHINDVYLPPVSQSQEVQPGLYSLPGSGHFMSNPDWTFPDTKLNRTWPVSSISTGGGSDTMNSSWSGVQDSSDFSDDSSSGEQFFAVGLHLVHAIDSKDTSSDEDDVPAQKECLLRAPMASQSMDNLYDCKSTYTWPPKHPWARRSNLVHNSAELDSSESLQSMRGTAAVGASVHSCGPWSSDPLQLPRNMWPTGLPSHTTSSQNSAHQCFGALHLTNRE